MKPPRIVTNEHDKVKLTVDRRSFGRHQTVDLTDWMTVGEMSAWLTCAQMDLTRATWPMNKTAPRVLP